MVLERTIRQLDIGHVPPEQAEKLGHLGFIQWLGALPGRASYPVEAQRAFDRARPFMAASPAIEVFCHLLLQSAAMPPRPLTLHMPPRTRRGGAQARRMSL